MSVWLVLPDPFSARLFFDTGIVDGLHDRVGDRLELILDEGEYATWSARAGDIRVTRRNELFTERVSAPARLRRRADISLDARFGFYPLSLRHSIRHGFHRARMQRGHSNWFLDPSLAGPLPRWSQLDAAMRRWHYGRMRYLPRPLLERLARDRPLVALGNMQMQSIVPFIVGGIRNRLPVVGNIASWDHTVGKGIVAPQLRRYLVQNEIMRDDLVRYHGIPPERIVVTGWPQTDVFHRSRPRAEYETLVRSLGLDPSRPLVVVMGNTPTNAPYEANFVRRFVEWWKKSGARDRFSVLFRPHPRDREWHERFAAALSAPGCAVQEPSFTDLESLAVLLQHCDVVVTNAGTILLDALANDRAAVCVLWDEGAPPGESWAAKNVSGEHYKPLFESNAFYRASRFDEVVGGIERALEDPAELRRERARVVARVLGRIDGHAADRVAAAIAEAV